MPQIIGPAIFAIFLFWLIRWAIRSELMRCGIFRAKRELTEHEMQEVMALMAEGKLTRAEILRNHYRHKIKQPE